jgi:hypothetical protein
MKITEAGRQALAQSPCAQVGVGSSYRTVRRPQVPGEAMSYRKIISVVIAAGLLSAAFAIASAHARPAAVGGWHNGWTRGGGWHNGRRIGGWYGYGYGLPYGPYGSYGCVGSLQWRNAFC